MNSLSKVVVAFVCVLIFSLYAAGTTKIIPGGAAFPLTSNDADPADAGAIRLGNAEKICWEADAAGTDVCLLVNSSEAYVLDGLTDCDTIDTDSNGVLSCGSDATGAGSGAFLDSGDPAILNTRTKTVEIGSSTSVAAKLEIGGDADEAQLVVQGHSTQTDDVVIILNDDATEVATISEDGLISALIGFDCIGAVDCDIGSADVLDVTVTTDGGDVVLDGNITQDAGTTLFMGGLMDATGAVDMDYGSGDITDHTFDSDGTGTAEFVLKAGAIDSTEILDDTITFADISDSSAIDVDTTFTAADGIQLTWAPTMDDTTGAFMTFNADQADDADGTDNHAVIKIDVISESGDTGDTLVAIDIEYENGTANTIMDAAIEIDNEETTAATMTSGILITSSGVADGITNAIDVSAANINNAIDIGANPIVFSTGSLSATDLEVLDDGTVTLTSEVTGILPEANGGTGANNTATTGAILIGDGSNFVADTTPSFTAEIFIDQLGIEFEEGDSHTDCSTFANPGGGIYWDGSESKFKKCQDNTLTDLDTTGAGAWTDADPIVQNTITNDVHVGDGAGTLAGKLEIGGDADQPQLVIEGFSTQTDDVVIVQNDADTEVATISNGGLVSSLVGFDCIGAVDCDFGSADVLDMVFTEDGSTFTINNGITISTGDSIILGTTTWNTSDNIDGEVIGDNTIDDDSIDFADVTCVDLTMTDCGAVTSTGTVTASVGFDCTGAADCDIGSADILDVTVTTDGGDIILDGDITQDAGTTLFMGGLLDATGAVDMDYGSGDITDHTFDSDGTGTGEFVLKAGAIDGTEILDDTITFADISDSSAIDADTTFTAADGINFTWTPTMDGTTGAFMTFNADQADDADGTDVHAVIKIDVVSESGDTGDLLYAIDIEYEEGTANTIMDAAIAIDNEETTASTMSAGILIESSGVDGGVVDAIDVSAANITNAIDIGANNIVTAAATIASTELDLLDTMTGKSGSDFDLITGTKGTSGNCAEWNADGDLVQAVSAAACGTGGNTAWSAIGDASGDGTVVMAELDQDLTWDTGDTTAAVFDGLTISLDYDPTTTDSGAQNLVRIVQLDSGGDSNGNPESLLLIENLDTTVDDAVAAGIELRATTALAMPIAIDASDAEIVVALDIGANTVAGTGGIGMSTGQTECVMLDAKGISCKTTGGCTVKTDNVGTNFDYTTADFATAADDSGVWTFNVPFNITGATFVARIFWTSTNAACNADAVNDDVCWTVASIGIADDAAFGTATLGTSQGKEDLCEAQNDLLVTTATDAITHGWVASERAIVEVTRDIDAGHADCSADVYAEDAQLLAVEICYEVDNVFSGE